MQLVNCDFCSQRHVLSQTPVFCGYLSTPHKSYSDDGLTPIGGNKKPLRFRRLLTVIQYSFGMSKTDTLVRTASRKLVSLCHLKDIHLHVIDDRRPNKFTTNPHPKST